MKKILISTVLTEAFYRSRRELIEKFIEMGYEIVLVGPDKDKNIELIFDSRKVTFHLVNLDRTGLSIITDFQTIKSLIKIIQIEKPDITYSFGGAKAAIYTTIASHLYNVERVYCMINGLGSIYRGHGRKNRLVKRIMNFLFKFSLSKADGVLFQNQDDLDVFIQSKLVKKEKCRIVNGSGVNLEKFSYHEPDVNNLVFLFVGRLLRDKGIYEFVNAAKAIKGKYAGSEFWVVGGLDSNPTSVTEQEISEWTEKKYIKYFGRVDNISEYYKKSSVFILPSYHEGTPRTNLEAMAVGRPIITTDAPGCKETVIDGKNGFLIPIKDVPALMEKIIFYINKPDMILKMGLESRKLALEKFDVNNVNKTIIDFILQ